MSFWKNVAIELEYQGMSRKELSYKTDVPMSTIHKGFERDSIPSADTAVRIAKSLNVSLEYLLDMTENSNPTAIDIADMQQAIKMYRKYNTMLQRLEILSQKECGVILQLVDTFADFHQRAE